MCSSFLAEEKELCYYMQMTDAESSNHHPEIFSGAFASQEPHMATAAAAQFQLSLSTLMDRIESDVLTPFKASQVAQPPGAETQAGMRDLFGLSIMGYRAAVVKEVEFSQIVEQSLASEQDQSRPEPISGRDSMIGRLHNGHRQQWLDEIREFGKIILLSRPEGLSGMLTERMGENDKYIVDALLKDFSRFELLASHLSLMNEAELRVYLMQNFNTLFRGFMVGVTRPTSEADRLPDGDFLRQFSTGQGLGQISLSLYRTVMGPTLGTTEQVTVCSGAVEQMDAKIRRHLDRAATWLVYRHIYPPHPSEATTD